MKKKYRVIAAFMAVVMLITSCKSDSGNLNSDDSSDNKFEYELDYDTYKKAEITKVENRTFAVNGMEGTYTGDWKGDRPEGNGEWRCGENDYYKGIWENGYLTGEGEICRTEDGGLIKQYTGICKYNRPDGTGEMIISSDADANTIKVKGDFSSEGTAEYFSFDTIGRLVDIGDYANGECISYLDNFDYTGMSYIPEHDKKSGTSYNASVGAQVTTTQRGEYFGELNDDGVPHGHGFLRLYNDYTFDGGSQTQVVQYLGEWENGVSNGLVMWHSDTTTSGAENATIKEKRIGKTTNGRFYGECTSVTERSTEPPQKTDGKTTRIMVLNDHDYFDFYHESTNYFLAEDGMYKTPFERMEYEYIDGSRGYSERRFICKTSEKIDANGPEGGYIVPDMVEGEYYHFDKDGNLVDFGIPINYEWQSTAPDREPSELYKNLGILLGIGIFAITFYAATNSSALEDRDRFGSSGVYKMIEDARRASAIRREKDEKRKELLKKAEDEALRGNYYDADRLAQEASEYETGWF